ncbi:hypothetical protein ACFVVX_15440 [Kitasatospora sp. NPDC058170]|uniref:hypothetical protein n=1 Tax=Kitasatospora sp. NPDC058170 TaxID=3346364 RepID=UPI0036D8997C
MPAGHPWDGSDTARFRQIGDVVAPTEAARVLGPLLGRPWREAVRGYLEDLYGPRSQARAASANPRPVSRRAAASLSSSPTLPGLDDLPAPAGSATPAPDPRPVPRSR